jgi:hypothetical protein
MLSESTGSSFLFSNIFLILTACWFITCLLMCRFLNNNLLTGEVPVWILQESKKDLWVYCEAIHISLYMKYTNLCSPQLTTILPLPWNFISGIYLTTILLGQFSQLSQIVDSYQCKHYFFPLLVSSPLSQVDC